MVQAGETDDGEEEEDLKLEEYYDLTMLDLPLPRTKVEASWWWQGGLPSGPRYVRNRPSNAAHDLHFHWERACRWISQWDTSDTEKMDHLDNALKDMLRLEDKCRREFNVEAITPQFFANVYHEVDSCGRLPGDVGYSGTYEDYTGASR